MLLYNLPGTLIQFNPHGNSVMKALLFSSFIAEGIKGLLCDLLKVSLP